MTAMTKTSKYIVNPDWLTSQTTQGRLAQAKKEMAAMGEHMENYFPEEYGKKIPDEGAWIMILLSVDVGKELPGGGVEKIHVPHLSIWFATPTVTSFRRKVGPVEMPMCKATIQTPQGEVCIWPHEYKLVDLPKFLQFTEEDGFYIHFMHQETQGFDEQKMFYLRSRGISKAAAQIILLPELKDPHFCYFTMNESYGEYFGDGCGVPVWLGRRRTTVEASPRASCERNDSQAGRKEESKDA